MCDHDALVKTSCTYFAAKLIIYEKISLLFDHSYVSYVIYCINNFVISFKRPLTVFMTSFISILLESIYVQGHSLRNTKMSQCCSNYQTTLSLPEKTTIESIRCF